MKVITLHQPWASLLVAGLKQFETRSWSTTYRGVLAIHSSQNRQFEQTRTEWLRFLHTIPRSHRVHLHAVDLHEDFSYGCILGTVELIDCHHMHDQFIHTTPLLERAVGDWRPGRWAWRCVNPKWWDQPVRTRGYQRIWTWNISS